MHQVFHPDDCPKEYDFEEYCPHCDTMIPAVIDQKEWQRYETVCPVCGKRLMLCVLCREDRGGICDWTEERGCAMMDAR